MLSHVAGFKLQPDQEHEKDQSQLCNDCKDFGDEFLRQKGLNSRNSRMEYGCERRWEDRSKKGWAEQQSRHNFSDHARLTELSGKQSERPCDYNDDNELDENREKEVFDV
jgi:hypothetical protein